MNWIHCNTIDNNRTAHLSARAVEFSSRFSSDMAVDDSSVAAQSLALLDVQLNAMDADAMVRAQSIRLKREKVAQLQKSVAQVE